MQPRLALPPGPAFASLPPGPGLPGPQPPGHFDGALSLMDLADLGREYIEHVSSQLNSAERPTEVTQSFLDRLNSYAATQGPSHRAEVVEQSLVSMEALHELVSEQQTLLAVKLSTKFLDRGPLPSALQNRAGQQAFVMSLGPG